jgi:hypothetical protein
MAAGVIVSSMPHPYPAARAGTRRAVLLLVPALNARLPEQLAVLLLCHSLAALLDH